MKFSLAPVALLAVMATGAFAQDSSSTSAASSSMTSSAASSSATSMSSSSSASGGSGGGMACTVLGGDPRSQPAGCPYSSTTTPPYNLPSLISYLIGGYTRGPEGVPVDQVASDMAGTVLRYYPTLLTPQSQLAVSFAEAISSTINAIAQGQLQASDLAPAARNLPNNLLQYGVAAAAVVAAGAFAL